MANPEFRKWKDVSSFSRDTPQDQRVPDHFEYRTGALKISVHRHMDYPADAWLVTCYEISLKTYPLISKTPSDACKEAIAKVKSHLDALTKSLSK